MKIQKLQKYGLQWHYNINQYSSIDGMSVVLKQQSGLLFLGYIEVHPIWGTYADVRYTLDDKRNRYSLLVPQYFYAEEFEEAIQPFRIAKLLQILREGYKFPKNAFKENKNYYRMSFTTVLKNLMEKGTPIEYDADIMKDLFFKLEIPQVVFAGDYRKRPFLYVNEQTYNALPEQWTVQDLFSIHQNYYQQQRQFREQLWYDIAEARANNEPVKIPVAYTRYSPLRIYTERITPYNISFPVVLPVVTEEHEERER